MKRILSFFGSLSLLFSTFTTVVSCGTKTYYLSSETKIVEIETGRTANIVLLNPGNLTGITLKSYDESIATVQFASQQVTNNITVSGISAGNVKVEATASTGSSVSFDVIVTEQPIYLSATSVAIDIGDTSNVIIRDSFDDMSQLTLQSSDESIAAAKFNEDYEIVISGLLEGTAKITIALPGIAKGNIEVSVEKIAIQIQRTEVEVVDGSTDSIYITKPISLDNLVITSTDESIATYILDKENRLIVIKGENVGQTTIKVSLSGVEDVIINVEVTLKSINIGQNTVYMNADETGKTVTISNFLELESVEIASDNDNIATVSLADDNSGTITVTSGLTLGETTITVTASNAETQTFKVIVQKFNIILDPTPDGNRITMAVDEVLTYQIKNATYLEGLSFENSDAEAKTLEYVYSEGEITFTAKFRSPNTTFTITATNGETLTLIFRIS